MATPSRIGTLVDQQYRLDALLGEGASGAVYRAERLRDCRVFALKLLKGRGSSEADRSRFLREAKALNALDHPAVVPIVDFGFEEGAPYIVMELLHGAPLGTILARGPLDSARALDVAKQVIAGLAYCHAHGVLHRDIKPGNILVTGRSDGGLIAKLVDFGLVKFIDADRWGPQSILTAEGAVLGTPAYMSPEQGFGQAADTRSDVYSAGILLFELVAGRLPYDADDRPGWIRAHALAPLPLLQEARPGLAQAAALDAILARAIAKEPADRFLDAGEFWEALARAGI